MKAIFEFFRFWWRWFSGDCPLCGGDLNVVHGFGPKHALRPNGLYIWCPSCHQGCRQCAAEDRERFSQPGSWP